MIDDVDKIILDDIIKSLKRIHDINSNQFWTILTNIVRDIIKEEELQTNLMWKNQLRGIANDTRNSAN